MDFSRFIFQTFTVTVASPAVFTVTEHGLAPGDTVRFETTGALPTGLVVDTDYYVVINGIGESVFQVSETKDGTPINTSGTQSGTHSYIKTNRASLKPRYENNK